MADVKPIVLKATGEKTELGLNDVMLYPLLTLAPTSNPPTNYLYLYALSDGFYQKDSLGVIIKLTNITSGVEVNTGELRRNLTIFNNGF
jgi:hypothetical protein